MKSSHELKLVVLLDFLLELFPNTSTNNPLEPSLLLNNYPTTFKDYHQLLTHFFTILNENNREKKGLKIVSQKEDVLMSLTLLSRINYQETFLPEEKLYNAYLQIKNHTTAHDRVTSKHIKNILGLGRTSTYKLIEGLREAGFLTLLGGYKNRGYIYKLRRDVSDKSEIFTAKTAVDIFEDFDDFEDNENHFYYSKRQ